MKTPTNGTNKNTYKGDNKNKIKDTKSQRQKGKENSWIATKEENGSPCQRHLHKGRSKKKIEKREKE